MKEEQSDSWKPWWKRPTSLAGLAFLAFLIGVLIPHGRAVFSSSESELEPVGTQYKPDSELTTGPQLWFIYVGHSNCSWSNHPDLPRAIERLKVRVSNYADQMDVAFKAIGLSLDWKPEDGLSHLQKFGRFDEIVIGDNLTNSMALDYFWSQGNPSDTPAVTLYELSVQVTQDTIGGGATVSVNRRNNLVTVIGFNAIMDWAESAHSLPPYGDRVSVN